MSEQRHGTLEELLALRDGEGSAWVREHVALCAPCAAELERLEQTRSQLKALPAFAPPRDRWPVIAQEARQERRRRRVSWSSGAVAAAAVLVLGLVALRHPGTASQDAAVRQAMAESAAMEQVFRSLQSDQRSLTGKTAGVVADLEDRLAQVDAALNDPSAQQGDPGRVAQLWKQRAGLLSALVDVHETRATYAGL
jgi:anti-sigma factor RsiW